MTHAVDSSSLRFDFGAALPDEIAEALARIALAAGPAIMEIYEQDGAAREKSDGSPVTQADERAEAIIEELLRVLAPNVPIVAEEAVAAGGRIDANREFFLVDPLDGTREFLKHNGEFTVNVALVREGTPVAGAVYAPAKNLLWAGGKHAWRCMAPLGAPPPPGLRTTPPAGAQGARSPDRACQPLSPRR